LKNYSFYDAPTVVIGLLVKSAEYGSSCFFCFIVSRTGIVITCLSNQPGAPNTGILHLDEGRYIDEKWKPGRRLNGDQDHQGRHIRIPVGEYGIQKLTLYRY
jgi:hypothetical protein